MSYDESSVDNNQAISNTFFDYFSLVYVNSQYFSSQQSSKLLPESIINVSFLYIFLSKVFEGLTSLGLDSTYGPDRLPPIVLSKIMLCSCSFSIYFI